MDLDTNQPGVSVSMHAPPSSRTAAPLLCVPPSAQVAQNPQVCPSPGTWKPLPSNLHFKKSGDTPSTSAQAQAGPSVRDKQPIEQVDDAASGDMPPKRVNPAVVVTTTAANAPANITTTTNLDLPHATSETTQEVDIPHTIASAAQDDMRVD